VRYNESVRGGWIISYVADDDHQEQRESLSADSISADVHLVGSGVDHDGNLYIGNRLGHIKHVRIYFDKDQPDLGYQLLLPSKPKALIEKGRGEQLSIRGIQGSPSSSSSSLSGGGEADEASQGYVWSSYTTYIVDFINQLLDKNWPGREYLCIQYPCPGSRHVLPELWWPFVDTINC